MKRMRILEREQNEMRLALQETLESIGFAKSLAIAHAHNFLFEQEPNIKLPDFVKKVQEKFMLDLGKHPRLKALREKKVMV